MVELTFARFPLLRLQTIDGVSQPFLYDLDWDEGVSLRTLRGGPGVRLRPDAGDQLIRLAPLVRPLVELHWVRMVALLNGLRLQEEALHRHLFGAERVGFPPALRRGLRRLQDDGCFYCDAGLGATVAVDHFIPWARWPNDAVENLVVAHPACNGHKSDRLPGPVPLGRWAQRLVTHGEALADLAREVRWRSDRQRTAALARSVYGHLPAGAPVWDGPLAVSVADPPRLLGMLAGV